MFLIKEVQQNLRKGKKTFGLVLFNAEEKERYDELSSICNLRERSSIFISFSAG